MGLGVRRKTDLRHSYQTTVKVQVLRPSTNRAAEPVQTTLLAFSFPE